MVSRAAALGYRWGLTPAATFGVLIGMLVDTTGGSGGKAALQCTGLLWMLYLGDRLAEPAPSGPSATIDRHRPAAVTIAALLAALLTASAALDPDWRRALVGGVVGGSAYFLPLPVLGRAKDIPCGKGLYAGLMVVLIAALYTGSLPPLLPAAVVVFSVQLSNALYDLKDLEADAAQGVRTPALLLGVTGMLRLQLAVVALLLAVTVAAIPPLTAALLASLLVLGGASLLLLRRPFDESMAVWIDGVWLLALLGVGWMG